MVASAGFGDSPESSSPEMPVSTTSITFTQNPDAVRMTINSFYDSAQELQYALDLNMKEGFMSSLGQIEFLQRD